MPYSSKHLLRLYFELFIVSKHQALEGIWSTRDEHWILIGIRTLTFTLWQWLLHMFFSHAPVEIVDIHLLKMGENFTVRKLSGQIIIFH